MEIKKLKNSPPVLFGLIKPELYYPDWFMITLSIDLEEILI